MLLIFFINTYLQLGWNLKQGHWDVGLTPSSLTVVLTVTDMANGQWTVEREKKCHSKETCMIFVVFTHIHISYLISHPIIQVNKLQVVFADLYGFKIYM